MSTPQKKEIIILGTGGNSVDILDTLRDINENARSARYECLGFLDDNEAAWGRDILGVPVLGPLDTAERYSNAFFVNGIGSTGNYWKKDQIIEKTGVPKHRFETIIHPTASVSRTAHVGRGVTVFQNVTITSNVQVGDHVIILPNAVISHDDVVGDYTCIAGSVVISGNVTIGNLCYLGAGCSIISGVSVSDYCLIGMGSVLLTDASENSVLVGNPARFLRKVCDR